MKLGAVRPPGARATADRGTNTQRMQLVAWPTLNALRVRDTSVANSSSHDASALPTRGLVQPDSRVRASRR